MNEETIDRPKQTNNWPKVLLQLHLHGGALYGLFLLISTAKWLTLFFFFYLVLFGIFGLTLGCHRLWAHRTYQAPWPLRLLFAAGQTLSCQGSILSWVRTHRLHHEKHGTQLDPYDYKKGFYYAHIASKCMNENPAIENAKTNIPVEDLSDDNVIYFQNLLYWPIVLIFGILLPINAPVEYWGESLIVSVFVLGVLRTVILLNTSWLIHSGYIIWGLDPLDKRSSDTWLVFFFSKSLWPQYHYLLPWDYRSGEFGTYDSGMNTTLLRVLAALGLATGLTTITNKGVKTGMTRAAETGQPLVKCLEEFKFIIPDIIIQDPLNA